MDVVLVVGVTYLAIGVMVSLVAHVDARRQEPSTNWNTAQWAQAIFLGPLVLLLVGLERVLPDSRDSKR